MSTPIKNPYLRHLFFLVGMKQAITDRCLEEYDLEIAPFPEKRMRARLKKIEQLKKAGLKARNDGLSFYTHRLSPGCVYCKNGFSVTVSPSSECTRNCFYCFQYRPRNIDKDRVTVTSVEVGDIIRYIKNAGSGKNIINLGISGGEPLLAPNAVLKIMDAVKRRRDIKPLIRLYTNGDLVDENILRKLKAAGLDEIRFGIKFGDLGILKKVELAKRYIPRVMMEGPVFPGSGQFMKKLLLSLNKMKISGVNLLDLRCRYNIHEFRKRGYRFEYKEKRPFYEDWTSQGWPVHGSEKVIFDLLGFALKKRLLLSIHYCPVEQNIDVSLLNRRKIRALSEKHPYETITREGLLRKIAVFKPDHAKAAKDLARNGVPKREVHFSDNKERLETHIENLQYLDPNAYEIAILDTLPEPEEIKTYGEEVGIKIIGSHPHSYNVAFGTENTPYLTSIGRSIASIYFRKRPENKAKNKKIIDVLNTGLKTMPRSGAIYMALALIYFDLGQYGRSAKAIKKVICLDPEDARTHLMLASCYKKLGRFGMAQKELDMWLDLKPFKRRK